KACRFQIQKVKLLADALGNTQGLSRRQMRQKHYKLIAAVAEDTVDVFPYRIRQKIRRLDEQRIACLVAIEVVVLLEIVHVHKEQKQSMLIAGCTDRFLSHIFLKGTAVLKTGQGVPDGQLGELLPET